MLLDQQIGLRLIVLELQCREGGCVMDCEAGADMCALPWAQQVTDERLPHSTGN